MKYSVPLAALSLLIIPTYGFIFDFGGQQQNQQQQQVKSYEEQFLNNGCDGYLCPITQECVKSSSDCACAFPSSELRCVLPNGKIMCVSKPATHDSKLNALYDDPIKGPKQHIKGMRDCGWVLDSYKGVV